MNACNQMIEILNNICIEENRKLKEQNSNLNYKYEILQKSDLNENQINAAYLVAKFYNENYHDNADFIHIPTFKQALDNILKFPIIIARETESKKILGISVVKYFESTSEEVDPYFPLKNTEFFSVTGILTNIHNKSFGIYGIGKKIYEIELRGALAYKQSIKNVKLMCVIDCRNNHSINALRYATNSLNESFDTLQVSSDIVGYYTVKDFENYDLVEAPTFVVEMKMDNLKEKQQEAIYIKYDNESTDNAELYTKMQQAINSSFIKYQQIPTYSNEDPGCGIVTYYPLIHNNYSLNNITIDSNKTDQGNNRIPISKAAFNRSVKRDVKAIESIVMNKPKYLKRKNNL